MTGKEAVMNWQPALGAWLVAEGCRFRVWAPAAHAVEVILEKPAGRESAYSLSKAEDGTFSGSVAGLKAGDRYRYRLDGMGPFPDPASRFQPDGVHGPSEIVDPHTFPWTDATWKGIALKDLVLYELHVGTFTPEGTFQGVVDRLPHLVNLGVSAIELMPIGDFPGKHNWGYDGVNLFAPTRSYGRPDDLRKLVDACHRLGVAVILDVVYNHLGPDGNYLGVYSPYYFSKRHRTAWGDALNFDGDHHQQVRAFFIENARYWIHEYHIDGLRLDATHAIKDDSPRTFLAELAALIHSSELRRYNLLFAEDHRNLACMLKPESEGGWGLDAVWADDFHHQTRRLLTGEDEGYYRDYKGEPADLATTIRKGWFFCGQHSTHLGEARGTDPAGIPPQSLVFCIQNHDQVGNRPHGERLHHQIEAAAYRAASTLLLTCPQTPMLFMGQEWAASSPFLYFTDHHQELGQKVTQGRRWEFRHFSAFADPQARDRIPDPQALKTFLASRLRWEEMTHEPHAAVLRMYRALLQLRRSQPALCSSKREYSVSAKGEAVILRRKAAGHSDLLILIQMRGPGTIDLAKATGSSLGEPWEQIFSTEDPVFSADPCPPHVDPAGNPPTLRFFRPGAIILRRTDVNRHE
jgi:maltooligosyltrehalose trehalohydrolase